MANELEGFNELSRKLSALGEKVGGKALRSATLSAMLPALRAAQAAAPRGNPPFKGGADPYPVKTYKGRLRTPGFASRNIARKSFLKRQKTTAVALLGVKPEAFYAINFVEFGTSSQPRKPWLEPSFHSSQGAIISKLGAQLKTLIQKAAKK